jgi:hypothetical protein
MNKTFYNFNDDSNDFVIIRTFDKLVIDPQKDKVLTEK